jgi:ABC-type multidrug transport system permease subunit
VADLESGYLRRLLSLPVARSALVLAPMLLGATLVVVQASLVLAVGVLVGADLEAGAGGALVILALALLWGLAFGGYSVATGLLAGNAAGAQTAVFVFFPLTFLAPTFLPRDQLQGWLETASAANPTTYVLEAMRSVLIDGWDAGVLAAGFGVVAALCALSLLWATRVAGRITARR